MTWFARWFASGRFWWRLSWSRGWNVTGSDGSTGRKSLELSLGTIERVVLGVDDGFTIGEALVLVEGEVVGIRVGTLVGLPVGSPEGGELGNLNGDSVGVSVFFTLGIEVGVLDSIIDGDTVGDNVGNLDRWDDGSAVDKALDFIEGELVGIFDEVSLGTSEGYRW